MRKLIRIFSLWILPLIIFVMVSLAGFVWWCFASQTGTRWLINTAVSQFDGQANGIKGSLRRGLFIDNLNIDMPEARANIFDFHLKVLWSELIRNRNLHINDISIGFLDLEIPDDDTPAESTDEHFEMPVLPIGIQIDRLALGGLDLAIGDEPLPVNILMLESSFNLNSSYAGLQIKKLHLAKDNTLVQLNGGLDLQQLAKPWPFKINLSADIQDSSQPSLVCAATWLQIPGADDCQIDLQADATGDLDNVDLLITANGTDLQLDANAKLMPIAAFPLGLTKISLDLAHMAGLDFTVQPEELQPDGARMINTSLLVNKLGLNNWLPAEIGESELNVKADLKTNIINNTELLDASLNLNFLDGNKWNGADLLGHINLAQVKNLVGPLWPAKAPNVKSDTVSATTAGSVLVEKADTAAATDKNTADIYPLDKLVVSGLDADIKLADAHIYIAGDLAAANSKLAINTAIPNLTVAWPDIPGGVQLNAVAFGSLTQLNGGLQAKYILADANATEPLQAPVDLQLSFKASLNEQNDFYGELSGLDVSHAQAQIKGLNTIKLNFLSDSSWQVGAAEIEVNLHDENLLNIGIQNAGGQGKSWYTKGNINQLIIDPKRINRIQHWLDTEDDDRGSITTDLKLAEDQLELGLLWDLKFDRVLTGDINLKRIAGDITVPTDVPVKLYLKEAGLNVNLKPLSDTASLISADLQISTNRMGSLRVRADTPLHVLADGGFNINPADQKNVHLQAESEDLAWVNLFLGGAQELGGTITADIKGRSLANGGWYLSGPLSGKDLSFVIPDQGVRLLDGTLQAHFDGMQLALDKLHFPAKQRVIPKESRVADWLDSDPEAKDGYLEVTGNVNLEKQEGLINVALRSYPMVQRSDRYVMLSGDLSVDLAMPSIVLFGELVVDTGWFDIDMLNDIPELSSDVIILKRGEKLPEHEPDLLDIKADISIDMGKRFYVTGFGLDTGVVGDLAIHLVDNQMRAIGALRTRGGEIKAYGQELKLRRGRITFQGDVTNPILDIEALRTDVAVQAGVAITGTARAPKIGLVSYPDVSETEKLTWLLLGHGPDEGGGGDMTLLFSVGSSFLSDGEPFYKKFGIDELSMRSGELGSTGSILPVESVVADMDSGASPIEERFLMASKQLTDNTKLSLEQALADTGTIARLSYRLMWNLRSEITVGTTNGLALVYRWFSRD